jgi:hypothetical protein
MDTIQYLKLFKTQSFGDWIPSLFIGHNLVGSTWRWGQPSLRNIVF